MSDLNSLLSELHIETAQKLLDRVKSGSATAQELTAAIKFLKDNNFTSLPQANKPLSELRLALPEFADEEAA